MEAFELIVQEGTRLRDEIGMRSVPWGELQAD